MAAGFTRARQNSALIKSNQQALRFPTSHAIIERSLKKETLTHVSPPRTIKLVLATCLAAWLADFFGLAYSTSAGIIAILSVTDTRRSTAKLAGNRFLSTLLALAVGSLAFHFLGFHLGALAIYIAIYVPLAFRLGWESALHQHRPGHPSALRKIHLLVSAWK